MTNIAKIKASRAKRANTAGRTSINVLAGLGDTSVVAYSTVAIPTRYALVYGWIASTVFGLTLIGATITLGLV
jgi:hypothetical protein